MKPQPKRRKGDNDQTDEKCQNQILLPEREKEAPERKVPNFEESWMLNFLKRIGTWRIKMACNIFYQEVRKIFQMENA